ncbi:hypothetical protein BJ742DRAFT_798207 [Cladochytrium replicatum]|nr:hypothetical protein BJ742DRAFT_798207 [Cladochytrium replicatum]
MGNQQSATPRRKRNRTSPFPSVLDDPFLRYFQPTNAHQAADGFRLSMQQHYLIKRIFKTNFKGISAEALSSGIEVLDVGSLTGLWLEEMERDFPASKLSGVDVLVGLWPGVESILDSKSIQLVESHSVGDIPYPSNTFDYVHELSQLSVTPLAKWGDAIEEFARVLKPGGYLDLVEFDVFPTAPSTPTISAYVSRLHAFMRAGGLDIRAAVRLAEMIEGSGKFTEVEVVRCSAPLGWGGEVGALWGFHVKEVFMALRQVMGRVVRPNDTTVPSVEEFSAFCNSFLQDCVEVQAHSNLYRITARKRLPRS